MIVVKLMGGLGNQMFQYAAAKALALHHGTSVKTGLSFLQADPNGKYTKRNYELGIFKLQTEALTDKEQRAIQKFSNKYYRKLSSAFPSLCTLSYQNENQIADNFFSLPSNSYLDGYWQSEKYFRKHAQLIRSDFQFKNDPLGENATWVKKISSCNAISVHIRRGDYVANKQVEAYHGVCSPDYYRRAVELLVNKYSRAELFFFSDDLPWVRENLRFKIPMHYIDCNQGATSFEDMRLMSLCQHNIIANSSFSWWGAWLNAHSEKTVIAPQRWFASADMNQKDIIPETWIKM